MKMMNYVKVSLTGCVVFDYKVEYADEYVDDKFVGRKYIMVEASSEEEAYDIADGIFFNENYDYNYIQVRCPITNEILT